MKRALREILLVVFAASFFVIIITVLASRQASAGGNEDYCLVNGGTWTGSSTFAGTCSYPPNSSLANQVCGPDMALTVEYNSDESIVNTCSDPPAASSAGPGYGGCGNEVRGPLPQPITLPLCGGKNGSATFPVGDCKLKCTVTNRLPQLAEKKVPNGAEATIYVRVIDPGGLPGVDSYTVCFSLENLDLDPPAIYRWVGGQWELQMIGNKDSNFICSMADGDGAFYLGKAPQGT